MENPYAAPQGEIITPRSEFIPLTWKQILFSSKGRIPRRQYWAGIGIQIGGGLIYGLIVGGIAAVMKSEEVMPVLLVPYYILSFWIGLAVAAKRCHDRDRSAWFMLIPFFNLWVAIECAFFRGTEGSNRFGEDPT